MDLNKLTKLSIRNLVIWERGKKPPLFLGNPSSKRNLKIPNRFEDIIHELNGKLKNNKNKNKEVNDVEGCLDGANETGGKGAGTGVDNKVRDANKSMDSNVVNGDRIEVDSQNKDDGCILEDVTPMMSKVHTTNVSSNTKIVHVTTPTLVNPLKQSYAKATTNFEVLIENKLKTVPTRIDENGDDYVIFYDELVSEGSSKWNLTLCGYFVGHRMHINVLRYNIRRMWSRYGFKEDINMSIDKLWVRMCNLPLEAWTINVISALASGRIGNPLIMDAMTTSMCKHGSGRIGYARVLVKCKKAAKEQNVNNNGNKGSSGEQDNNDDGFVNVQRKKVVKQNKEFKPKAPSTDNNVIRNGVAKNVRVIGEKLKHQEKPKSGINDGKMKKTSQEELKQYNQFDVLNELEEGKLNEMEGMLYKDQELLIDKQPQSEEKGDLQNKKCIEEVEDLCDMDDGIAKDMNVEDIRGRDSSVLQHC
ncbi:zinc knuckle CX2CX4HX4C containing protein [Tanacetum coccineum]